MGPRLRGSALHGITNENLLDKLTDEELWEWYRVQRLDLKKKEAEVQREKKVKEKAKEASAKAIKEGMKAMRGMKTMEAMKAMRGMKKAMKAKK